MNSTCLASRAVIRLSPLAEDEDVRGFLQGLVTSDTAAALPVWSALLTPQGKVIADFLIWQDEVDLLIDGQAQAADALIKRLSMYRLRRKIGIARDDRLVVHWKPDFAGNDPRLPALGTRWIAAASGSDQSAEPAWLAHRLSLGVCEGGSELGDLLWLECNAAELNGVSFTKGCYVGQENTARMNWRAKVNRRLVVVPLARSVPSRQRVAYPELGLAVDHLRVEDIAADLVPGWMVLG